jgi:hypothetical protein
MSAEPIPHNFLHLVRARRARNWTPDQALNAPSLFHGHHPDVGSYYDSHGTG